MKIRFGRAAILAILFLGSQAAPGLHAAFEAGHDIHACCTDNESATHFDVCDADHDAPPCQVCANVRAPSTTFLESNVIVLADASVRPEPVPVNPPADPYHVETPDSRGPPR